MAISLELPEQEKQFEIFNQTIEISPERQLYNHIRGEFYIRSKKIYINAEKSYDIEFEDADLDILCKEGNKWGVTFISQIIHFAVKELHNLGVFDMTKELFIEQYYSEIDSWESSFMNIYDKYMSIVLETEQLNEYRADRKANRGKFIGGGFGLSGAISGVAQAGALNLATGVLHSGFNLLGKAFTAIANKREKSKIFDDPNTKKSLLQAIKDSVFNTHIAFIKVLVDYNKYSPDDYISNEDENKCIRLLSNLKSAQIPKDEIKNVCLDIINTNPFNNEIYMYMIDSFGDENKEIQNIAEFFYFDISEYKINLSTKRYNNLGFKSENKILDNIEELKKYCQFIGFPEFEKIRVLEKCYEEYINQPFIVDGFKYFDTQSKDKAVKEINNISNNLKSVGINLPSCNPTRPYKFKDILTDKKNPNDVLNTDSILCSTLSTELEKLAKNNSDIEIAIKLSTIVKNLQSESLSSYHGKALRDIMVSSYNKHEVKAKNVDGKIYLTIAEAQDARNQLKEISALERKQILKQYGNINDIELVTIEHIKEALYFIENFKPVNSETLKLLSERKMYFQKALIDKEIHDIGKVDAAIETYTEKKDVLKKHIESLKTLPSPSTQEAKIFLRDTISRREAILQNLYSETQKTYKDTAIVLLFISFCVFAWYSGSKNEQENTATTYNAISAENTIEQPNPVEQEPVQEAIQPVILPSEPIQEQLESDTTNPPFIGKRSFNFMGGTGTGYSITISQNGNTVVMSITTEGSYIIYEGPFTNPILYNESEGILLKDGKVYSITDDKVDMGCSDEQEPCVSELYTTE